MPFFFEKERTHNQLDVGRPGFEPGTNNLRGYCSTVELPTQFVYSSNL